MKAAKTWCVAGLMLVAGLASVSCGKDEGTNGGTGGIISHGGTGGAGAGGGRTGGTGGGAANPGTKLGRGCLTDTECDDATAPGLKCITATDTSLGDGAPPKGLCTTECAADADCSSFGAGSICYPFGPNNTAAYCVEGCNFGTPDVGTVKCHSRPEFACNPALFGKSMDSCKTTTDCQTGELCLSGFCNIVFPACLPSCRGDIDCEADMYCDQSFLGGTCVAKKQTGKALGEPCTMPPDTGASEPDECIGFCQADAAGSTKGHCATTCGLFSQCAWNAGTKKFDGACFYGTVLTPDSGDPSGDFGFCTPACNCADDCKDATLNCEQLSQGPLNDQFRGAGLCFSPDDMLKDVDQCGAGGAGSSGGAAAGGAAAGGAPADSAGGAGGAG